MYNFTLKNYGEVFAEAQTLTGTSTIGNKNIKVEAGKHLGGLGVSVLAKGPVTVAVNGQVTIAVETSETTTDGDFTPLITYNTQGVKPFVTGFAAQDGQEMARLPLPEAGRYIRVKLAGSGVTGTVDCALVYLPR